MASRSLDDLISEVRNHATNVQQICRDRGGFDLLIYCTARPLDEQAKLYRQSRTRAEIEQKMQKFESRGFGFLANVIESVGPCSGGHVTNAGPGESWHNYGEAWDAVPLIGGKAAWSYADAKDQWNTYGEAVRQVGMNWAGDWQSFREYPHAQLRTGSNPLKLNSPDEIKIALQESRLIDSTMFA